MTIRCLRRAEQTQPHNAAMDREAVLAVVQDTEAVGCLGEVGETVTAALEFRRVPGGVEVGGAGDEAVLGFGGEGCGDEVGWEFDF